MNIKKIFRLIFGRTFIVLLSVLFQALFFFLLVYRLSENFVIFYSISMVLTAVVVIYIINDKNNPSFKLAWMIPVLVFPVFGSILYIYMKIQLDSYIINRRLTRIIGDTKKFIPQYDNVLEELENDNVGERNFSEYMDKFGGYPVYKNTAAEYFPIGEKKFEALKRELMNAKEFIFMEYFIIECGYMWNTILDILIQKVNEGVEVRVMYDGMCSLVLLPYSYPKTLQKLGIKCKMFSPLRPALSSIQNNRDHRKIVVIDGHTAFTGGVNLADEYINKIERFGHWKDTAIMIKGEAVNSFTIMFLQNWNIDERLEDDYSYYLRYDFENTLTCQDNMSGYFLPYSDSPLDNEDVGQNVYMDILYRAKNYVYIMTPYLILGNEMQTALQYAAKRGVDVRIIMPHIPDKKYAYWLARTYYAELIEAGVKIFEYVPGFVHAKVFLSDDERAVVGSINLDYRSFFLHFECAVYCYGNNNIINDISEDFSDTFAKCCQITHEDCKKFNLFKKFIGRCLRLIAPLM